MSTTTLSAQVSRMLSVAVLGGMLALTGCNSDIHKTAPSQQEEAIATKACQLTTQLMQRGDTNHECIKVELDRKVTDTFYQAHAILEDGGEQPMGIRLVDKESQEITIVLRGSLW